MNGVQAQEGQTPVTREEDGAAPAPAAAEEWARALHRDELALLQEHVFSAMMQPGRGPSLVPLPAA